MAHSPWNKSHCYDPTAKAALDNIEKQRVKPKSRNYHQSKTKSVEPLNRIGSLLDDYTKNKLFKLTGNQGRK